MSGSQIRTRIGLFGGTFDPIHVGHLVVAEAAREWARLDRIWFLPSASPPHKADPAKAPKAPFRHRLRMTRIAAAGNPAFRVSDREGARPGPSYTVDLLREFRRELGPRAELHFLIGADWVANLASWKDAAELFRLCRFLVVPRPGFPRPDLARLRRALGREAASRLEEAWIPAPEIGISSTEIRERIAAGRSVRYLLPAGVESYIRRNGLYGA
ncbi:MAG: nicotinate-nucleotide adenylyltransferase [Planctomycetes bacterium]|nr:nicotinate-nucleotide adenylyltransferase [Planctomycetota bacterium]